MSNSCNGSVHLGKPSPYLPMDDFGMNPFMVTPQRMHDEKAPIGKSAFCSDARQTTTPQQRCDEG